MGVTRRIKSLWNGSALAGLFVFYSCAPESSIEIPVGNIIPVSGFLNHSEAELKALNLRMNLIGPDGIRRKHESFKLNTATGQFEFTIKESDLSPAPGSSMPEQLAALGEPLPENLNLSGQFSSASTGFARIEFYSESDDEVAPDAISATARMKYHQARFPVARSARYSTEKALVLHESREAGYALKDYAKLRVSVKTTEGDAIEAAQVILVPYFENAKIYSWTKSDLATALSSTNAQGLTTIFPLSTNGVEPVYQVIAMADGYCPSISPPRKLLLPNPNSEDMRLNKCSDLSEAPKFEVSFDDSVNQMTLDNKPSDRSYAHVNQPSFPVQIKFHSRALRKIKAEIFLDQEPLGTVLSEKIFESASDLISIDMPKAGKNETGNPDYLNGTYLVRLTSVYSREDQAKWGNPQPVEIYINFSRRLPVILARHIKLTSMVGQADIISGLKDRHFLITSIGSTPCPKGAAITALIFGLSSVYDDSRFYPCDSLPIKIPVESLGLERATPRGGSYKMQFFLRNEFGSVSESALDRSDRKDVYLDFGRVTNPSEQQIFFGTDFGFTTKGSSAPTDTNATVFGPGRVISPASFTQDLVVRFASPSRCRHLNSSSQDGLDELNRGAMVDSFYITGVESSSTDFDESLFRKCGSDMNLSSSSIKFPTNSSDPASFSMKIRDYAGNISDFYRFEIPACGNTPSNFTHCWAP